MRAEIGSPWSVSFYDTLTKAHRPPSHWAYCLAGRGSFMQTFYKICLCLMIVGGINWGLVGLFQFDFVGWLLGGSSSLWSRIVFTAVGAAALCGIPGLFAGGPAEE